MMFNLFHIAIIALTAAVAIGSPAKAPDADFQTPLCNGAPTVAQASPPPTASPRSIAVFRNYKTIDCAGSSFNVDYELAAGTCYSLPYTGATLLYITCGQVNMYPTSDCTGDHPIVLSDQGICYRISALNSIQLLGC